MPQKAALTIKIDKGYTEVPQEHPARFPEIT
jgi:hypothetical protein